MNVKELLSKTFCPAKVLIPKRTAPGNFEFEYKDFRGVPASFMGLEVVGIRVRGSGEKAYLEILAE